MLELNELSKKCLENAERRESNGGQISTDTRKMLKHLATEVCEAVEVFPLFKAVKDFSVNGDKDNYTVNSKNFPGEIADIVCCCMIIAAKENIDLEQAIYECMAKNKKRAMGIGDKL